METERTKPFKNTAVGSDGLGLFDIPVYHGQNNIPFSDLTNTCTTQGQAGKGKGVKKWKRVESKREVKQGEGDSQQYPILIRGSKKRWSLKDEEVGEDQTTGPREKRPCKENLGGYTDIEVGVASLN